MTTGSTKSRASKREPLSKTKSQNRAVEEPQKAADVSRNGWLMCCLLILAVGSFLRTYRLDLVPLHHDEGVNGNFLVRLVREGAYQYDPENYHGPSLYYFSAVTGWVLRFLFGVDAQNKYGLNTVTIRLVTALFGIATIALILSLRRRLGTVGSLSAAALLAVSPGAVYLSRYFIHETLFVFFALGIVVAGLKYFEEAHPIYLMLAAASAALLFATKETFIINAPVLLIALVVTQVYLWFINSGSRRNRNRQKYSKAEPRSMGERVRETVDRLGGPYSVAIWSVLAVVVFIGVSVLFYSSFFTNSKGIFDSLRTFEVWTKTGQQAHVHPRWKYIEWLTLQESPLLLLGSLGAIIAVLRPRNSFALFSAFWAFGTFAAYSLVPYKTPWLTLNMIVPLAIVSGWALQAVYEFCGENLSVPVGILLLVTAISGFQTIDLNFFNYDNDKKTIDLNFLPEPLHFQYYDYVYAHTHRETLNLVEEINRIAQITGERGQMGITIVSPDYWPLPWYLRDYTRVGYFGHMAASTEPVVIASEAQRQESLAKFGDRYQLVNSGLNAAGSYTLRPGVELLILVRKDVRLQN